MQVEAVYFDGKTARPHAVRIYLQGDALLLQGDDVERREPLSALRISPPLGSTLRLILFADGGRCEVADQRGFAAMLPHNATSTVSGMENSWRYALVALVLTLGLLIAGYRFGLPYAAKVVAERIPVTLLAQMDEQFFTSLDQTLFKPSALSGERRQEITFALQQLVLPAQASRPERIEFRSSPQLGANAFALPGGAVVVLDQLVELAENDQEILAVLAHEMGHIAEKHVLRQMLQASVVGLAMSWYVGDISSLLAAAPTVLLETRYSREYEHGADQFAAELLRANGISPARLADMLQKLEIAHAAKQSEPGKQAASMVDYLSSHPNTKERIKRLREM